MNNKEKHSLCNFAALESGGATQKKFLPTSNVTFDTKGANFENYTLPQKHGSRIKTPQHQNH